MSNASMSGGHATLLGVVGQLAERRARERGLRDGPPTDNPTAGQTASQTDGQADD